MKVIQQNIDKVRITDEGMKEAVGDFLIKHKKGILERLEKSISNYNTLPQLVYKAHVKSNDNPNFKFKGIEVVEQGLDHYELEENDIREALEDYVQKHQLGEFVSTNQSSRWTSDDSYSGGYNEYFYEVKLNRI